MSTPSSIDAATLRELLGSGRGPRLLDVRTPAEFDVGALLRHDDARGDERQPADNRYCESTHTSLPAHAGPIFMVDISVARRRTTGRANYTPAARMASTKRSPSSAALRSPTP